MKVLVTGCEGQLARSLAERASDGGGIDLILAGRPLLDLEHPESIERTVCDIKPDVIINAAAYTAVDMAEDEPERAFRVNGAAAGELAAAARKARARIVHISTDYVFDGSADRPYDEQAPANPQGVYGRSKLVGEELVRANNPQHVIIRTSWVYSPFGRNFLKSIMAAAEQRDSLQVVADQVGNPSSALDIADGLFVMLNQWCQGSEVGVGRTYHLSGTGSASWFDLAVHILCECERLGEPHAKVEPIRTVDWPTKAARPANSQLDSSRFEQDFAYKMPEWRESVSDVVRRLVDIS
jgi:dTDP-4-dehydrorhamnose reductase